jgi:hypothetical protein
MERTTLIKNQLSDIKILKEKHQTKSDKCKKISDFLDVVIIATGSVSTSLMIIGLSHMNPIFIGVGTALGFVSTFVSVVNKTLDYNGKALIYKSTANSLSDIYRDTNITLGKNGLSTDDKAHMLNDINHRLSIIENNSLPI